MTFSSPFTSANRKSKRLLILLPALLLPLLAACASSSEGAWEQPDTSIPATEQTERQRLAIARNGAKDKRGEATLREVILYELSNEVFQRVEVAEAAETGSGEADIEILAFLDTDIDRTLRFSSGGYGDNPQYTYHEAVKIFNSLEEVVPRFCDITVPLRDKGLMPISPTC